MNDLLGVLAGIAYLAFFFFVIKLIAYYFYKRKIKKLEPYKKVIDGITYYELHKGNEVCVIGNEHKMIRSQMEKIVPLYNSKVISFREGVSISSTEYAHCIDGTITFGPSSSRKITEEELKELSTV